MTRRFALVVSLMLALVVCSTAAINSPNIKIMTQNMDQGTGLGYVVAAAAGAVPDLSVADAVDLTFAEIQASHLEKRAGLIAGKIAGERPEIVALQEVTLWQIGKTPETAVVPVYDQLTSLLLELLQRGAPYYVVAVNTVDDVTLPGNKIGALRLTSRNVLLARVEWRFPMLRFSDVRSHVFESSLDIFGLEAHAGWISAKVHQGGKQFILVATHLQSTVADYPPAAAVQVAQAGELLAALQYVNGPVVLCGDFNSDANDNPAAPDATPTADNIKAAGYTEVWGALKGGNPGNTWPLYLDDLLPISFPATPPVERIDLFFERGMDAVKIERVIAPAPSGFAPPYGSDHAGVAAVFDF